MAFVPEDGTGLAEANSLIEIEFADTYFADRGNAEWGELSEERKQQLAILGTSYVATQYSFQGQRLKSDQGTPFPRKGVYNPDGVAVTGIPTCVKQVVCELAWRAESGPLIPDPEFDESGRAIKQIQQYAGPLRLMIEYAGPGQLLEEARFPAVDALMCPWLLMRKTVFSRGVRVASPGVTGVSNSQIAAIHSNEDRFSGPINENGRDVGHGVGDGNSII